ncbi:hypothetical protein Tco_0478214 [Tanacetum coccineum]
MIELESLFSPLFEKYFNGENQVVSKSFSVTTADASDKRQQQPYSTSSTSTLATTVTADGNFNISQFGNKGSPNAFPLDLARTSELYKVFPEDGNPLLEPTIKQAHAGDTEEFKTDESAPIPPSPRSPQIVVPLSQTRLRLILLRLRCHIRRELALLLSLLDSRSGIVMQVAGMLEQPGAYSGGRP